MSLLQDKNFQTRTLTGIVFVAVIVAGLFIHPLTMALLGVIIGACCLWEFYTLTLLPEQTFFKGYMWLSGLLPMLYVVGVNFLGLTVSPVITGALLFILFLGFFLQLQYVSERPFNQLGLGFLGWVYISIPMSSFLLLASRYTQPFMPAAVLLLFALVWVNDTGAYISGVSFGRTKFFERISPKKTWEGTLGGVALCMLLAAPYGKFILNGSPLYYAGMGLVIGVFSTLGDLIESQLKRSLGIKDSGTILPGHGGFLDRFDGFLMAIPAAYIYSLLFGSLM